MHARVRSLRRCRPTPWAPKRQTEFDAWQPRHSAVRVFERASALERARRPARRSMNRTERTRELLSASWTASVAVRTVNLDAVCILYCRDSKTSARDTRTAGYVRPQRDTNGSHTTYAGSPSIGAKPVGGGDRNKYIIGGKSYHSATVSPEYS